LATAGIASNTMQSLRLAINGIEFGATAAGPGNGPLVVLLHGFPDFSHGWRRQIPALAAAGLRVVAPDQRGCNRSAKPAGIAAYRLDTLADDILGLADALGAERFAVIGHDWGGVVAWHLAARNPERVTRAAILNAPHPASLLPYMRRHPRQALKSWYVGFFQLPLLPELALRAGGFRVLLRALRRTSQPSAFTDEDLRRYREAWRQPGALTAMLNWYRALRLSSGAPLPERVRVPVRVIWGDRDAFLERGLAEAGTALCDQGEVFHLPEASHWLHLEQPGAVNRLLLGFLRRSAA
jgi:pimeloyl-ACP methyl ester carboxylesterase